MGLTDFQFWLLDALVDTRLTAYCLARPEVYVQRLCREPHFMTTPELVDVVLDCCEMELIDIRTTAGATHVPIEAMNVDRKVVWSSINKDGDDRFGLAIGLTPKGGKEWENVAIPDWSKFVGYYLLPSEYRQRNGEFYAIGGMTVEVLRRQIEYHKQLGAVVIESQPAPVSPFNATYWKQFQSGFEQVFECVEWKAVEHDKTERILKCLPWTKNGINC